MMTDITDVEAELRAEVLKRGARRYRLEPGTLMVRNNTATDTAFFLDEREALADFKSAKHERGRP